MLSKVYLFLSQGMYEEARACAGSPVPRIMVYLESTEHISYIEGCGSTERVMGGLAGNCSYACRRGGAQERLLGGNAARVNKPRKQGSG